MPIVASQYVLYVLWTWNGYVSRVRAMPVWCSHRARTRPHTDARARRRLARAPQESRPSTRASSSSLTRAATRGAASAGVRETNLIGSNTKRARTTIDDAPHVVSERAGRAAR